ncbi:MAG: hypothetical protein JNK60_01805 [Acidobacteria bacterium]|nr:hypothetical protein [Acidobacteriota bacterium]
MRVQKVEAFLKTKAEFSFERDQRFRSSETPWVIWRVYPTGDERRAAKFDGAEERLVRIDVQLEVYDSEEAARKALAVAVADVSAPHLEDWKWRRGGDCHEWSGLLACSLDGVKFTVNGTRELARRVAETLGDAIEAGEPKDAR